MYSDQPHIAPTPYPEVNRLLQRLLHTVRDILQDALVGMYLYGSLAAGDYHPVSSDIDVLVATRHALPQALIDALGTMHAHLAKSGLPGVAMLEVAYIPVTALRRFAPPAIYHPALGAHRVFAIDEHGPDWVIQRAVIRDRGVVVYGPPPATLIDPITLPDIRAAVHDSLMGFWATQIDEPQQRLQARDYQAYAILTMCRALYLLEAGALASKSDAAVWAQATLAAPWPAIVAQAMSRDAGQTYDLQDEAARFIRYTIARWQAFVPANDR